MTLRVNPEKTPVLSTSEQSRLGARLTQTTTSHRRAQGAGHVAQSGGKVGGVERMPHLTQPITDCERRVGESVDADR